MADLFQPETLPQVRRSRPVAAPVSPLYIPGERTRTSLALPSDLSQADWLDCGRTLAEIEGAVQWWIGDWWAYGVKRGYGESQEIAEKVGIDYKTVRNLGAVVRGFELSRRRDNLSFSHHETVAGLSPAEQDFWLTRAAAEDWSRNQLRAAIAQGAAFQRTRAVEFTAEALGKFVVIYADPPWRYENPPMGGSNRSIENHYPTMELDDICAMPVAEVAHDNCVLFLWATSPKLYECMKVLDAWGFNYRTDMVWVKDKIGMGYHVRGRHESLLIAKRGELPPPAADDRPDSVIEAPRLDHSAKPPTFYDIIDRMYPGVRKLEMFQREAREGWLGWGNQSAQAAE